MNAKALDSNISIDDHVEHEIASYLNLDNPKSFFLYAGAGSGKTRSLIEALQHIKKNYLSRLQLGGQQVAVVTYTNAACEEIIRRTEFDPTYHVSTIHSFAWKLIEGFNKDIREWLRRKLKEEISEIRALEAKGRAGTKASNDRLAQIESKGRRLDRLDEIKTFTYSPAGDNRERNSLNHSEVIEICASFLSEKKLMQGILVNQYPFFLVDESQDTNKRIVDALLTVQAKNSGRFSLGFIGDSMQRIYNDGKENIENELPADWAKPAKRLNHRCPKRIVKLINQVRAQVDNHSQEPRHDSPEGVVRLFIFSSNIPEKAVLETKVRAHMADLTKDVDWNTHERCKILTLEHHMAARRMGFDSLFEALGSVDEFRTGLLDGTLPATRLFTTNVLPLVTAARNGDKFSTAKIVRDSSPLLNSDAIREATDQREQLRLARGAVEDLVALWDNAEPTCGAILENIAKSGLFSIPESMKSHLIQNRVPDAKLEAEQADPIPETTAAIEKFLQSSFAEIEPYARYISDRAEFGTHQGVKGLEFERVMVLMDDGEARGFMFGYDKFFGAKELTSTDIKNEAEGRDSAVSRTRRLFYVTCSRAKKSLALIVYSTSPANVRAQMIANGWFDQDEIILDLP
jgi:DNA helicase-2/ATP-dependent DNA helicase PcrA